MRIIKEQPSDFIFMGILGALLVSAFIESFLFQYVLSWNHYAALCLFIAAAVFRFSENRYRRFGVGLLLILGCFNVLNFTASTIMFRMDALNNDDLRGSPFSINPIFCLLTLVYAFINLQSIKRLFQGSDEEIMARRQKKVSHYKVLFGKCSPEELEKIKANIDKYPAEAKAALEEIEAGIQ
jgi:hypothetical protein